MQSLATITRPPPKGSWLRNLLSLPPDRARKFIESITEEQARALKTEWIFNARDSQYYPEGPWRLWVINAGRGFGKTRAGAEWVKQNAMERGIARQALVAPTNGDLRKVMIEGESGILAVCPGAEYSSQRQTVIFPNGNIAEGFSAEEPERLRGPQFGAAWCDELGAWKYDEETWDNLQFGLRLGDNPQCLITSTPRPRPLYKKLLKKADHVSRGSTFENKENLAPGFIDMIQETYEGTRLGRQELFAELLEDVVGALWSRELIKYGICETDIRVVVGVDPAVTANDDSDETGIIVGARGNDGKGRVKADLTCKASPNEWASIVVNAYHAFSADCVVAEVNNGGDLVETVIRTVDPKIKIIKVHAARGKLTRAEPIAALYEQGKIEHEKAFDKLEDQMCNWVPDRLMKSPDRMDALVWSFTELMLKRPREYGIA